MLEQPEYIHVKVNNEIELCEMTDLEAKGAIEKVLLANRISYFVRWNEPGFFSSRKKSTCIFCINKAQKEEALRALEKLDEVFKNKYKILCKKAEAEISLDE
ncbi:MAG: hypothetical protein PHP50_06280 [Lachnospiraceae bacterium]|nr:hypothetical protein [Lachnospiraceae bacterium]